MPKVTDLNGLFTELLKDVYYAEKKILKTLPKLAKAVGKDSDLGMAFEKHRQETEGQVERLEKVFKIVDQSPKAKKCEAIEGILAEGDELMKEVECKATLRAGLLSGAQAVEHYEIARYGTLIEWAKMLGYDEAAKLLQETLEQEKNTDQLLTKLAEREINQAARDAMESDDEEEKESPEQKARGIKEAIMARKYSRSAGKDVEREMRRFKKDEAKSGKAGHGGKVKSRKQAIAIALSKARKKGEKVPKKRR